ncbi:MAG: tRNA pseudouridine(55) synthase TruB, partial [Clostridia bacterium]|nr:tRNA pseudouridine(55) synthase TruB [Clostridia bacterium]
MSTPAVEPSGILLINKHAGATSHDIVYKVRRAMHTKRVGHTGTLDPMATGVLVVLVGRAAKACEYVSHDRKVYRATLRLGLTTDTEDTTGTVLTTCDTLPLPEQVKEVCERFVGKTEQIPPMYSALKVDGQKLCDLARQGIEVERKARPIEIYALSCEPT